MTEFAIPLDKAWSIAKAVAHRQDGISQALATLEQEVSRLETNAQAVSVWMDAIDSILGCEFERDESSPSGKSGFKCRICGHWTTTPTRGSVSPCREKVNAARLVPRPA